VIVCPRCSKENQDHYKFCLGCGAELPRDAGKAPKSFTAPTPPSGMPAGAPPPPRPGPPAMFAGAPPPVAMPQPAAPPPVMSPPAAAAPTAAMGGGPGLAPQPMSSPAPQQVPMAAPSAPSAGPSETVTCPRCSQVNPRSFKFCGSCGFNLHEMEDAAAPMPPAGAAPPAAVPMQQTGPLPAQQPTGAVRGSLVIIRPDGTEGDTLPLYEGSTTVGRDAGGAFANDAYLSPSHATFTFHGQELRVKDEKSLNGIYLRIERDTPTEIGDGSIFRIGQEIIRFEKLQPEQEKDGVEAMGSPDPGFVGRVCLIIGRETYGNAFCVPPDGAHCGRERGDIIFPEDGYVSGLHCRIHGEGGKVYLTDVGSSNGTFVRVTGQTTVKKGSLLLMGQQLFRAEY
jgi:pSer/pThr/pTyr-binding forkhead associated (FHA) protein